MSNRFPKIVVLLGATFLLQVFVFAQEKQNQTIPNRSAANPPKSVTIHQEVDFKANPERLYRALLNAKEFSGFSALSGEFSVKSARIDSHAGDAFSLFDGHIVGRNVELVPNKRIVQAWRVVDWPPGVYSIVKFDLQPRGSGTHLVFDHTGFPENWRDHLAAGWQSHYWDPLAKYLR